MPAHFFLWVFEHFHYILAALIVLMIFGATLDGISCLIYRHKVNFIVVNLEELGNWASEHKIKYKVRGDQVRFKKADDASLFKLTFV